MLRLGILRPALCRMHSGRKTQRLIPGCRERMPGQGPLRSLLGRCGRPCSRRIGLRRFCWPFPGAVRLFGWLQSENWYM